MLTLSGLTPGAADTLTGMHLHIYGLHQLAANVWYIDRASALEGWKV